MPGTCGWCRPWVPKGRCGWSCAKSSSRPIPWTASKSPTPPTPPEAGQQFLHTYAPVRAGYDAKAIIALTVHLEDIGSSVAMEDTLPRLAKYLAELMARHRVDSLGARPGHLHLAPLERAGYTHRQHLYVLGLDEGSFPGRGIENPILLDEERARLSARLSLSPGLARYRRGRASGSGT